mmetsp:Transcript_21577/g.48098  ORF Transcript_21577/g.48098 Transcript_21577/m.48098 type:complete len:126 (+) Transcript_21577:436-813(+)
MGFIIDDGSYLRDTWNWLDFSVVVSSLLSFAGLSNVSGLRTFRLFRPLRSLNAIPSMKKLITTVIDSFTALNNIFLLAGFFFIIFGIFAINLWTGSAHQHCRLTPIPIDGLWPVNMDVEHLCGGF